ncbi:MAG: YceI family protein [Thermodesulfobacteriota bacterium]|nr:YceI family protein [Thermodesulfobacteriota bacterium]
MKAKMIIMTFLCISLAGNFAHAQMQKLNIDKVHSNIYFDVRHIFSLVRGSFDDFSGTILVDPEEPLKAQVEFTVQVDSINTNIEKRDNHLRSEDFFASEKYPEMTFKSTGIKRVEGDFYVLEGYLTVKDVTQKIDVPFKYQGRSENPMKKGERVDGFEGEFTIDRLDYHVGSGKYAVMGLVSKAVRIIVTLETLD